MNLWMLAKVYNQESSNVITFMLPQMSKIQPNGMKAWSLNSKKAIDSVTCCEFRDWNMCYKCFLCVLCIILIHWTVLDWDQIVLCDCGQNKFGQEQLGIIECVLNTSLSVYESNWTHIYLWPVTPFHEHGLTLIPEWISNYDMWGEIIYTFQTSMVRPVKFGNW